MGTAACNYRISCLDNQTGIRFRRSDPDFNIFWMRPGCGDRDLSAYSRPDKASQKKRIGLYSSNKARCYWLMWFCDNVKQHIHSVDPVFRDEQSPQIIPFGSHMVSQCSSPGFGIIRYKCIKMTDLRGSSQL